MAHDVFISYSSQDKAVADAICASLESRKIRCWIAPRDVLAGRSYAEALIDGIHGCRIFVLVFSVHSNDSPQVTREVERAVNKGIPIIPFRIQEVMPSKAMEYFVSSSHWLDALTPPLERNLLKLADTVQVLLLDETEKLPKAEPETSFPEPIINVKRWWKHKPNQVIAGFAVLVVILIVLVTVAIVNRDINNTSSVILSNPSPTTKSLSLPPSSSTPIGEALSTPTSAPISSFAPAPTTIHTPTLTTVPIATFSPTPTFTPVLSVAPIPIPPQSKVLFEDNFNNTDSGWQVLLVDNMEYGYEGGEYSFTTKKLNWVSWGFNTKIGKIKNFILDIDARQVSGPNTIWGDCGLIFRSIDSNSFYCFLISPDGQYCIAKARKGNWEEPLRPWTSSGLVKQNNSSNHLRVVCKDSQIDIYINGYNLATVEDQSYAEGQVGVLVGSGETSNHVHFDNMKVFSVN